MIECGLCGWGNGVLYILLDNMYSRTKDQLDGSSWDESIYKQLTYLTNYCLTNIDQNDQDNM